MSILSDDLQAWFDNFSQFAAVDMCEGGDDKECVAEICIDCLSCYDAALYAEYLEAQKVHGRDAVFAEVTRLVRTL